MFEARVAELETLARDQGLTFSPSPLKWCRKTS